MEHPGQDAVEYQCLAHRGLRNIWPWSGAKRREGDACKDDGGPELRPGSRCTTINAVVRELRDPGMATPCQTVQDWIGPWLSMTWHQRHGARELSARLDKLKHHWKAVCGPLTTNDPNLACLELSEGV